MDLRTPETRDLGNVDLLGSFERGEFPRTIKHAFGETEIESAPERVATVSWANQDAALALGVTAAAAAVAGAPTFVPAAEQQSKSPNERLQVAVVGVRGRGQSHLSAFSRRKDTEIVAVIDPDEAIGRQRAEKVGNSSGRKPQYFKDMRKAFEDKSIDIVSIATPNHWHALAAIWAIQAGKDYHKLTGTSMYHALTLLRFGRFDEVLAVGDRPEGEVQGGLWDFAQGYAHLREGDADFGEVYLKRVQHLAETSEAQMRFHSAENLLGVAAGILEGELLRESGDLGAAVTAFENAVTLEDSLGYDEPEPLPFAARHWLGAVLLELERYADAERVYREELQDHPHNGWSLFGLQIAIKAQGQTDEAVDTDLEQSWARADIWLRASRF